jgi:hypothetical protein
MMTKEALLALVENNPKGKMIEPVDLPENKDPDLARKLQEIKEKYLRPECFPPELKFLIQPPEDGLKKSNS